jgi:uncharacterized protein (DUF4415 family)
MTTRKIRYPKLDLTKAYRGNPEMWRKQNPDLAPQLAVALDPDVTLWLESLGKRAKTRVNAVLRAAMKASR